MAIPKQKTGLQGNPVSPFFSAGRQTCRSGRMSASVTVGCRFAPEPPKPYKKCALNPPVLPCKRSTSLNTNRSLYFLFALLHFQNRRVAPAGMQSAVALSGSRASESLHNMRFKSTSVTVQTLYIPECKQVFAFPFCTSSFSKQAGSTRGHAVGCRPIGLSSLRILA